MILGRAAVVQTHNWFGIPSWSTWTDGTDTGNGGERGDIRVCKAPRGLWLALESCSPVSIFSSVTGWLWRVIRGGGAGVSVGRGQIRGHQAAHAMWQPPPRPSCFTPGPRAAVPAALPE